MRRLHEVVIFGMALALVSATLALAGGKGGGGANNTPSTTPTAKTGSNTNGDKVKYQKFEMNNAVITSTRSGGGGTGTTKPSVPTTGTQHR